MTVGMQDFTLYVGQTKVVTIPVVDSLGAPLNMTGYTKEWGLWQSAYDLQADAILSKADGAISLVNVNGTLDGLRFTISAAEALTLRGLEGRYYHEARVKDGSNNEGPVTIGTVTVEPSPTAG
jgi:hypothetical protein